MTEVGDEVYFQPHEPLLHGHGADSLGAHLSIGSEFYSVWLPPDQEHLLTIADLEPTFGTPYASNPEEFFVWLWFPWDPEDGDRMRCRLMARVRYGEEGGYDDKTNHLEPWVDRTLVHLDLFDLNRGVTEAQRPTRPKLEKDARARPGAGMSTLARRSIARTPSRSGRRAPRRSWPRRPAPASRPS